MTLRAFMRTLATDPVLAERYRTEPEAIMDLFGLAGEARDALRSRDPVRIGDVLRRRSGPRPGPTSRFAP
jgi:hypothetical protein